MTPVQWNLWLEWIEDPRDLTYRQWIVSRSYWDWADSCRRYGY